MFAKLSILTLALVFVAGTLLVFRQQRLELANRSAATLLEIRKSQEAIWAAEARASAMLTPEELQKRVERAQLALERYDPHRATTLPGTQIVSTPRNRRTP